MPGTCPRRAPGPRRPWAPPDGDSCSRRTSSSYVVGCDEDPERRAGIAQQALEPLGHDPVEVDRLAGERARVDAAPGEEPQPRVVVEPVAERADDAPLEVDEAVEVHPPPMVAAAPKHQPAP